MNLEFQNVSFVVSAGYKQVFSKNEKKVILNNVNGVFQSGKLSAILGPSGCGKTSLLKIISGYECNKNIDGEFKLNDQVQHISTVRKMSRFIMQEDQIQPHLTLNELMLFASKLKLAANISDEKRQDIIDSILADLGLLQQKETKTHRLSGGQKKRLSIGLELINDPVIFMLDEPTSGLDDVSTKYCVNILQKLSRKGYTIICSIHQPSSSIFHLFDHIYVMAQGHCIYQGDSQSLVPYLSRLGNNCPIHYNPADYIIEIIDASTPQIIKKLSSKISNGRISYCSQKTAINDKAKEINRSEFVKLSEENAALLESKSYNYKYPISQFQQFKILLNHMLTSIGRQKVRLVLLVIHHVFCSCAAGTMFFGNANNGAVMFEHLKLFIGLVVFFTYTQLMITILTFPSEVKAVRIEIFNRWYGLTPYYAALTCSRIPLQILLNMLFNVIVYILIGYPQEWLRFVLFAIITNLISLAAEGLGLALGSTFNIKNGTVFGPTLIAVYLSMAIYGFDFPKEIPYVVMLLLKLSFMRAGTLALIVTMFGFGRQQLACADVFCFFDRPKSLLRFLDMENESVFEDILILVGLVIMFRVLAYVGLKKRIQV